MRVPLAEPAAWRDCAAFDYEGPARWHGYAPRMSRKRLDAILAERGLFETRSRAAAAVLAGDIRLGDERRRAEKPGQFRRSRIDNLIFQPPG